MQNHSFDLIRIAFSVLFVLSLVGGGYLFANYERFFGADSNVPSENSSSRAYSKVQVVMIWVHVVGLSGALALLLH
jgi:hypothetical protein